MAGVGIRLNKIFEKNSIAADLYGFTYSTIITVAPMFVVIGVIALIQWALGFSDAGYAERELFADTVLYIFIFSLLSASPFNAVLSRYLSDIIFEERWADIIPCYYVGMMLNVVLGCLLAIPFCVHEYLVGEVPLYYVLTGYFGFLGLLLVFYSMLYLSISKDYKKISLFFTIGMGVSLLLSIIFKYISDFSVTYNLLLSLVIGFYVIASLEAAQILSYFRENSRNYSAVFRYFRKYWQLILTNFLYTFGLYVHNFVFWATPMHLIVAKSFVTMMSYDMASCLAMFTNISATVIFISRVEMRFHERYKAYSEAVIGGRKNDIDNTRNRMFQQLSSELMTLVRIQFIITVVIFLLCVIFLPRFGFSGETLNIYHSLSVGYFILFLMYAEILFLYYFNDLDGALMTTFVFALSTAVGAYISTKLPAIWYGLGLIIGSFIGFTFAYVRIRWIEKNINTHTFCNGIILRQINQPRPSSLVYDQGVMTDSSKGRRS